MKEIINIKSKFGSELHTRQLIERLAESLDSENEYLLDMRGVQQISRSAADELYSLIHSERRVETINLEPFVEKMLSAVTLGRFLPRARSFTGTQIVECPTLESAIQQLAI